MLAWTVYLSFLGVLVLNCHRAFARHTSGGKR